MKIFKTFILLLLVLAVVSCGSNNTKQHSANYSTDSLQLNYANGFSVFYKNNYKIIKVTNPFNGAVNETFVYVLYNKGDKQPVVEGNNIVYIQKPIQNIVCMSTTQIGYINALGLDSLIVGLSGADYVYNKGLQQKIAQGKIVDVGYESGFNYEVFMGLNPDLAFMYGINSGVKAQVDKLSKLKKKAVIAGEYLEPTALAKAEWLLFFSAFFDKEQQAKQIMDSIALEYNTLKEQAIKAINKPKVLVGVPWKGVWYLPGGQSLTSQFITDAGGEYLWADNEGVESFSISLEDIMLKSKNADVWMHTSSCQSLQDIVNTDSRLKNISVFGEGKVLNNCKRMSPMNGNDYFESGVVNPHIILKDIVSFLHPELVDPNYELKYYKVLK